MARQDHLGPEVIHRTQSLQIKPVSGQEGPMSGYEEMWNALLVPDPYKHAWPTPSLIMYDVSAVKHFSRDLQS